MELKNYPASIEAVSLEIININQRLADYRRAVEAISDSLTFEVVFAVSPETQKPLFTNEQQRSTAIRDRQRDHQAYQSLLKNIEAAEQARAVAAVKAERLKNEFKIAIVERQFEMEIYTAQHMELNATR